MTALKLIKQASLVVSAGMLFTACASHKEETNEYSSGYSTGATMSEQSGAQATYSSQTSQSQPSSGSYSSSAQSTSGQNEIVIPLHEEQFNVGKKSVPAGEVTIKKIVTTETVSQPIELRRERVIIEREGAGAAASGQASSQSSGAAAQAGVSAGSSGASVTAGAGGAGVSASAQAPSVQTSSTTTETTTHDRTGTVGAQLNQRAANAERTVAGNEPVGAKGADYNSITGVPRSEDEQTTTTTTTTSSTLPEDKSLQAGARVSESAGAQAGYQSGQSSYQSSSSTATSPQSGAGAAFQEQTYTIQLNEEQPVIEKSVKQTGRVVARKSAEWEKQTVQRELRREDVQVDKGSGLNVELRGDFSEAAGAQSTQGTQSSQEIQRSQQQQQQQQQNYQYEQRQQQPVTAPSEIHRERRDPTTRGGAEDLLQDPD